MSELNWDLATTCDWLIQKCWELHERHPGGADLFLTSENLEPQDPPFNQICKAAEYLQGKEWVIVEYGRAFGRELPIFVKIKLTPKTIADFRDMLRRKQKNQVGFITDNQNREGDRRAEDGRNQ